MTVERTLPPDLHPDTLAVRVAIDRSQYGENSEALYLTTGFVQPNSATSAERFQSGEGYTYARTSNPTVTSFERRLAAMEGTEAAIAASSGMGAILLMIMGLLKAGDHVVISRSMFGSTLNLFSKEFAKFGVQTTQVSQTDVGEWRAAVQPNTKLFYLETPSNPLTEIIDIRAVADIAHACGALLAVDNCFCSPALQKPLSLGADLVVHSATKYIDGQGRVLGGAVVGSHELLEKLYLFVRSAGPTLSAFNAWVLLSGLETLFVRMERQCANALQLARWLETHPAIEKVYYPGLPSHPQHELAMRQQTAGGAVVSFIVKGGREAAWKLIDSTQLVSITANLGDVKTTITHPATTTHGRVAPEVREKAGIVEGLVRVAVGLEHPADVQADLARGLEG